MTALLQDIATPVLTALGGLWLLLTVALLGIALAAWVGDMRAARQRVRRRGELDKARAVREAERIVRARRAGGR